MKKQNLKIKTASAKKLKEHAAPYNPRRMSSEEKENLTRSIKEYGFVIPITKNKTTGNIVSGHQRLDIAVELGIEVPYVEVELTAEQERLANVALNNIRGEFDTIKLEKVISEILEADGSLEATGLNREEINDIRAAAGKIDDVEPYIQQITIKIHKTDSAMVKQALKAAKDQGPFKEYEEQNKNSNGNAIARIAEAIFKHADIKV